MSADRLAEQVYPYPDQVMASKDGQGYVDLPVLHTVSEVAEALHVTDLVVYRAIREGHVYAVQIGKRYLIPDHQMGNLHEYVGYTQLASYGR
ncbi:helix-turn-helix domain-containing protein [Alicyclobacillus cycloheptanicus]|uniref:Excisionase family DNA binding protein n=1 Tax=Alicyclobacillus cycloheptanicus TaxID=1457 RepID=A0ABT9XJZ5_9BACL|nr:helix-turn-helix domain-containing protein [Alicyclobacillus cycloheptanicus]MCL6453730.1 helix-turn-helix domain-containing protein [Alicyclobacillus sp.]MDQ0190629.1 excisionase family DNA binding protein [Alicyclobacillus cycloheptanicus]WDM01829.1 helix-turn-helix domain-containing protein [Alicyclobacillus cycloheptanicus]